MANRLNASLSDFESTNQFVILHSFQGSRIVRNFSQKMVRKFVLF